MHDAERIAAQTVERHRREPSQLLQILIETQDAIGYLPAVSLTRIAGLLGLPRARVEGVAGFYSFLHTEPVGRYRILFSDNITDRMLGSRRLMDDLCSRLGLEPGRVSSDGVVSVDTTSCSGMGDQGPAMLLNGVAVTRLDGARIERIAELVRDGKLLAEWPDTFFQVEDNVRRRDALLGGDSSPGAALEAAMRLGRDGWLEQMRLSN
ncbi:complex I 24 kDa subunit family protein, partial [Aromatoleum diolicum]